MNRATLVAIVAVLAGVLPAQDNKSHKRPGKKPAVMPAAFKVVDYKKLDRNIRKEPEYVAEPRYALFLFGDEGNVRMWAVADKSDARQPHYDVLYFDRNADGDLCGDDERIHAEYDAKRARAGMGITLKIGEVAVPGTKIVHKKFIVSTTPKAKRDGFWFRMMWRGEVEISGGYGPVGTNTTVWGKSPETAPVFRPTAKGPFSFGLYGWGANEVKLKIGGQDKVFVMVGNKGSGPDTLAVLTEDFLNLEFDELYVTLIAKDKDGKELRSRKRITAHC